MWRMLKGLLLVCCLLLSRGAVAQSLLSPQVEINSSALALSNSRPIEDLKVLISETLSTFTLPIPLSLVPTYPIPVQVQITLRSGDGLRYVGDVEVVMSRPVYGTLDQTPILVVRDKEVSFEVGASSAYASLGQALPSDPLMLRLLFYITEGLVYYYDSFDIHGGNSIMDFVKKERSRFTSAWQSAAPRMGIHQHTPERWLMEMESSYGAQMRELWFIYHREILDSERTEVTEENLSLVLPLLSELSRTQQVPLLVRLLTDAKASEVAQLIEKTSPTKKPALNASFQELFPTFALH